MGTPNEPDSFIDLSSLLDLVKTLTGKNGCPWDKKQTPGNMAAYLMEEAGEVSEAVAENDPAHVCEELGDVLFHIVFLAHLYQHQGFFHLGNVISQIHKKMIRRHPHVFGDTKIKTAQQVKEQWQQIKNRERTPETGSSFLNGIPKGLHAMMRAYAMTQKAARIGFDWQDAKGVMDKMEEEWAEFQEALNEKGLSAANPPDSLVEENRDRHQRLEEEIGDLMFTLVNLARHLNIHPESALARANEKFQNRFSKMEKLADNRGLDFTILKPEEMDLLWETAKKEDN